jgi:hypothetical protein
MTIGSQSGGRAGFLWVRLGGRIVIGALLLLVLLVPLLGQEGERSTAATVYGYVACAVVFLVVGASIYRLLRRNGIGARRASIVGLAAAPVTYLACVMVAWLLIRIA